MKSQLVFRSLIAIAILILYASCASIVSKSAYPVSIDSNPRGADITIFNKKGKQVYNGKTPSTVKLKAGAGYFSKAKYSVKLSSQGFKEEVIPVSFKMNGWYFGNLLFGGVLGLLIIDPATGAMWKLRSPPAINVTLDKSTASVQEPTLEIRDIKDVPANLRPQLVRIK